MITDHRSLPRRRGPVLEEAILDAAITELTEVGYANLTMERVAIRARASKASVYSRWPTRMELVMDAFYQLMADPASPPDTGTLREDLITMFQQTARSLAGPAGEAIRGLLTDVLPDAGRTAEMRRQSHQLGRQTMEEIARRAVAWLKSARVDARSARGWPRDASLPLVPGTAGVGGGHHRYRRRRSSYRRADGSASRRYRLMEPFSRTPSWPMRTGHLS
jgi:AcrR family transcriptional regulator